MADFLKQENGLLVIPEGRSKFNVSWTLDNILEGFRYFYKQHNRWPIAQDLSNLNYLPTVKTLERKFGGIVVIRKALGIANPHFNAGEIRSQRSKIIGKRGYDAEESIYTELVRIFHEPFVHNQGRIQLHDKHTSRADFIVYHQGGKFIVDVFFPDSARMRFINNCVQKVRTYNETKDLVFCVIANPDITKENINDYLLHTKTTINKLLQFVTFQDFIKKVSELNPLNDPYSMRR